MTVRDVAAEAYKEILPALVTNLVGDLVAGVAPRGTRVELRAIPGLLVLVPALLTIRGSVYGSLGTCIATALHQGLIEPHIADGDEHLQATATATLANGVLISTFAAVVTYFLLTFLGSRVMPLPILIGVAIVAGLLFGVVLTVIAASAIFAGYRRGRNPDTIAGPVVTTTGDVFGVLFLLTAVGTVPVVAGVF